MMPLKIDIGAAGANTSRGFAAASAARSVSTGRRSSPNPTDTDVGIGLFGAILGAPSATRRHERQTTASPTAARTSSSRTRCRAATSGARGRRAAASISADARSIDKATSASVHRVASRRALRQRRRHRAARPVPRHVRDWRLRRGGCARRRVRHRRDSRQRRPDVPHAARVRTLNRENEKGPERPGPYFVSERSD